MKIFIFAIIGLILFAAFSDKETIQTPYQYSAQEQKNIDQTISASNSWQYEARLDQMSSGIIQTASITSNNIINLDFPHQGGTIANLQIRYHPRYGKDLIFTVSNGQLKCEYNNCTITLRYDENPPIKAGVSEPADNDSTTYFISNFKKNINLLKKSKKLYVEAVFFRQGAYTFEFNTADLDTVKLALIK